MLVDNAETPQKEYNAFRIVPEKGANSGIWASKKELESLGCHINSASKQFSCPASSLVDIENLLLHKNLKAKFRHWQDDFFSKSKKDQRVDKLLDKACDKRIKLINQEITLMVDEEKLETEILKKKDKAIHELSKTYDHQDLNTDTITQITQLASNEIDCRSDVVVLREDIVKRKNSIEKLKQEINQLEASSKVIEAFPKTEEERVVDELNKIHAVVHTSQTYFLREKPHEIFEGMDFVLESKQSFKDSYENKLVKCTDDKYRSKAEIWIKSPDRREYKGITFDPTGNAEINGFYNIWKGFACKSVKGSCEHFKRHIEKVICNGNETYYQYVWKWLAKLIQKPHEIPEVAILLMGLQGTGKGVFAKGVGTLFGQHFLQLDSTERLLGNFNNHMKNAVYIFADESIWGGNRKDLGKLKAMISEAITTLEPKGKDVVTIRNYRHFIFASNEEWPVALDPDDRRFFVLSVSAKHKENYSYFKLIENELKNGGYEALLYELQHEDISDFNPRVIPNNIESFEVKLISASSSEQYIYRALQCGCFDIGNGTPNNIWPANIAIESVFSDYEEWCLKQRFTAANTRIFGKTIKKLISGIEKKRPGASGSTSRPEHYFLPSLEQAKQSFQKVFKMGPEVWSL